MESDTLTEVQSWVHTHGLTLLVFTTPDCGVCDSLKPRISQLAHRHRGLQVRYVNATASPEVAGQFGVFAVPVYILSVNGKEAMRFARYFGMAELENAVQRYGQLLHET